MHIYRWSSLVVIVCEYSTPFGSELYHLSHLTFVPVTGSEFPLRHYRMLDRYYGAYLLVTGVNPITCCKVVYSARPPYLKFFIQQAFSTTWFSAKFPQTFSKITTTTTSISNISPPCSTNHHPLSMIFLDAESRRTRFWSGLRHRFTHFASWSQHECGRGFFLLWHVTLVNRLGAF